MVTNSIAYIIQKCARLELDPFAENYAKYNEKGNLYDLISQIIDTTQINAEKISETGMIGFNSTHVAQSKCNNCEMKIKNYKNINHDSNHTIDHEANVKCNETKPGCDRKVKEYNDEETKLQDDTTTAKSEEHTDNSTLNGNGTKEKCTVREKVNESTCQCKRK